MDLDAEAMKCAVEMEVQAATSTTTRAKGDTIKKYLEAAYAAGRASVPQEDVLF